MIKLGDYIVKPTIFPDKTSQVWKLPEEILKNEDTIIWYFENEAELSHLLQLAKLSEHTRKDRPHLIVPYLPYGRQDKEISNTTTFARNVIIDVLIPFFYSISTYDIHSKHEGILNLPVEKAIEFAIINSNANFIVFPDEGAAKRNYNTFGLPSIHLTKVRDQLTGSIIGLSLNERKIDENANVLLVDDLCDGGRTFVEATKLLKRNGIKNVSLYTTHGIYSSGLNYLFVNEIDKVFNLKGQVYNG